MEYGLFDISVSSLIAGFIFGVIGWWLFREGRKRSNNYSIYIGLALMIYPYFIESALKNWVMGIALCMAAYYFWEE